MITALTKPAVPEVVQYLEEALAEARAGNLTGILLLQQDVLGVSYVTAGIVDRYKVSGFLFHALHCLNSTK